jgi:triacylglycerol lipase
MLRQLQFAKFIMACVVVASSLGLGVPAAHAMGSGDKTPPGYTQTNYPIMLAHGLFGFNQALFIDYFYGVKSTLEKSGATVYASTVSAANSSEYRGEQLLAELRRLSAAHGHKKFNLIGHSHGSHSVRYLAAVAPDLVASVTVIGGPNHGAAVADWIGQNLKDTPLLRMVISTIVNIAGGVVSFTSTGQILSQDSLAALNSLSSKGAMEFNRRFPQGMPTTWCGQGPSVVKGIRYYSATGVPKSGWTLDPSDLALLGVKAIFEPDGDGLVGRCSAHWGQVIRDDFNWNHADEINQVLGVKRTAATDTLAFYRTHVNRLKEAGL